MKKIIYVLFASLVVVSTVIFANYKIKNETNPSKKELTLAERKIKMLKERKKWEASPDGVKFKEWENSSEGKKVNTSYDKIKKNLKTFSAMEATVTSVTFKRENANLSGPKWLLVAINNETYMLQFIEKDFEKLKSLKVNDKIILKSRSASNSPNHPYLILSSDYISKDNKILFQRDLSKNKGC